jgi:hypothetical protein
MKIFAALAVSYALQAHPAHAIPPSQSVCANLASIGQTAAIANANGYSESAALAVWTTSVRENAPQGRLADALKEVGYSEIHAVYAKQVTLPGEGYWIGYNACMTALQ